MELEGINFRIKVHIFCNNGIGSVQPNNIKIKCISKQIFRTNSTIFPFY